MSAFVIVVIVVGVIGVALALSYFSVGRATSEFGRHDQASMYRSEEAEPGERAAHEDHEPPLPRRPLRGRPL